MIRNDAPKQGCWQDDPYSCAEEMVLTLPTHPSVISSRPKP